MTASRCKHLLDLLDDLLHDLGKYIRLPLAMLPHDATPEDLREALAAALLATRRGPAGTVPARQIWTDFDLRASRILGHHHDGLAELRRTVELALAWEAAIAPGGPPPDRSAAEHDLAAVREAIRALRNRLDAGG